MTDKDAIALCIWREARNQGHDGMLAVACVIMNRVNAKWGTLPKVIYGKNQFTSMSVESDSQFTLMPKAGDKAYAQACDIAEEVLDNKHEDITKRALYYANLKTMDKNGWFERNIVNKPHLHPETATIGAHTFFA